MDLLPKGLFEHGAGPVGLLEREGRGIPVLELAGDRGRLKGAVTRAQGP